MKLEFYQDKKKEWRWRAVAANGKIVGESGEGYKKLSSCVNGAVLCRTAIATFVERDSGDESLETA